MSWTCENCGHVGALESAGVRNGVRRYRCRRCRAYLTREDARIYGDGARGFRPKAEHNRPGMDDVLGFLSHAQDRQDWSEQFGGKTPSHVTINLQPDEHGIARMVCAADAHLGNRWTDYAAFADYLRYIEASGTALCVLGDMVEMFLRPIKGAYLPMLEQIISPDEQVGLMKAIYTHLGQIGALKLIVTGNHDDRARKVSGISLWQHLITCCPVVHNRIEVTIRAGDIEYQGVMAHKLARGRSYQNPVHENYRELKEAAPDADFIVGAHTHIPAVAWYYYGGRAVPLVKTGAFNSEASYATEAWGRNSAIFCPVLEFDCRAKRPVMVSPLVKF